MLSNQGRFACANMMLSKVSAFALLRFFENAMPTVEKRRSTDADDAGHPRYCRAITSKLGKRLRLASHQSVASRSVLYLIGGSARYTCSSSPVSCVTLLLYSLTAEQLLEVQEQ